MTDPTTVALLTGTFTIAGAAVASVTTLVGSHFTHRWQSQDTVEATRQQNRDRTRTDRLAVYPQALEAFNDYVQHCWTISQEVESGQKPPDPNRFYIDRDVERTEEVLTLRSRLLADPETERLLWRMDRYLLGVSVKACRGDMTRREVNTYREHEADLIAAMQAETKLDV